MVKLSQIEEYKNRKKPAVFRRAWGLKCTHGGILRGVSPLRRGSNREGAQPLATFWTFARLQGARKWRSGTRWGPNSVVYEGLCSFEPRLKGDTPLKIPPCVHFSPQARTKNRWFFTVFVFFNLAQFHHILTLFTQVIWCLKQVLHTNYDVIGG